MMLWMLPILATWTHNAAAFAGQQRRGRSTGFGRRPTAFFGQAAATRRLRPPSPPGILRMGVDQYDFQGFCFTGNAIMVLNKDIKKVHSPGSTDEGSSDAQQLCAPLTTEEEEWLLDQAKGFKLYTIKNSFVLITKQTNKLLRCPGLCATGWYENDSYAICTVDGAAPGPEYDELVKVARKLTPEGNKLSFAPGQYSFSATSEGVIEVAELKSRKTKVSVARMPPTIEAEGRFPLDFELIIGQGEKGRTFRASKAVLCCFFPGMEELVAVDALGLPGLDPEAVQLVLDEYSTRKNVKMRFSEYSQIFKDVELAKETFGVNDESVQKKHTEAFLSDPRWLDATFLVGPNKEVVKGNRAVLASMNAALCRILFGTETMTVDPSVPIDWPQFEVVAVQCIFEALVRRGKEEVVVPIEHVESTKKLVDFLMETKEDLRLYYDTPFKREFEGWVYLEDYYHENEDGGEEGLRLMDA